MRLTYAEYDRMETTRDRNRLADADDAADAAAALEMRSTENDDGSITIEPEPLSWPAPRFDMLASVSDWARAVSMPRQYAEIANGIVVRVGDGKRKRRAA